MADVDTSLFREIHRLRKHLRDLKQQLDRMPISLKAYQNKVTKQEQILKDAQEGIKKLKVALNEREVSLKSTNQLLAKYEKQANDMTTPKEVEAKQTEIDNTKKHIADLEEEILFRLGELDEKIAKIPDLEEQLKKAREQLKVFEDEMQEHRDRLNSEMKLAEADLKKVETRIPPLVRNTYDRMVKAYGADGLAGVKNRSCGHCNTSLTTDQLSELSMGRFIACGSCGRVFYMVD